jgi:hypothetical protein
MNLRDGGACTPASSPNKALPTDNRYARALGSGYVSGFPLFEQGLQGGVLHYGVALINGNASFRHVLADTLGIFDRFSFDRSITDPQKNRLLERHSFAISRITQYGGPYYHSPPLKAEICIAGNQSLVDSTHRDCVRTADGYAVMGESERRETLEQLELERIPETESADETEVS